MDLTELRAHRMEYGVWAVCGKQERALLHIESKMVSAVQNSLHRVVEGKESTEKSGIRSGLWRNHNPLFVSLESQNRSLMEYHVKI